MSVSKQADARISGSMSQLDPGLDRHEWETEWQALEEELESAPAETLPEAADLVERMLEARGYAVDDPVAREGDDPEVLREWASASETAQRIDRGESVDPGDVAAAINGVRLLYSHLIGERSAP
jgi:hypothetical protein